MINILVVDDDSRKAARIGEVIDDIIGESNRRVTIVESLMSACAKLETTRYDLLILDVRIPRRDGGEPELELGVELLKRFSDGGPRLRRPRYVVGLTAFEEADQEFGPIFDEEGWHLLLFDDGSEEWANRLARVLVHVAAVEESAGDHDIGLLIITALAHEELEQVLELDADWQYKSIAGDASLYHAGSFKRGSKQISTVAAAAVQMGMPATTALAVKAIMTFRPKYVAMVGIAAGVKGQFGDLLIADQTWDYGSGKSIEKDAEILFEPAPEPLVIDPFLRCRLAEFRTRRDVLDGIRRRWPGDAPEPLAAWIGPIASGAAVLENRWQIDRIRAGQRKVIGVEMEAYGLFLAAHVCPTPKPLAMSIKSICDFGDSAKSDKFHTYAAFTSAQFLYEFALEYL